MMADGSTMAGGQTEGGPPHTPSPLTDLVRSCLDPNSQNALAQMYKAIAWNAFLNTVGTPASHPQNAVGTGPELVECTCPTGWHRGPEAIFGPGDACLTQAEYEHGLYGYTDE